MHTIFLFLPEVTSFSSGGFIFSCALTHYRSIHGGEWREPRMLSGTFSQCWAHEQDIGTPTNQILTSGGRILPNIPKFGKTLWHDQGSLQNPLIKARPRNLANFLSVLPECWSVLPGYSVQPFQAHQDSDWHPWIQEGTSKSIKFSYHVKHMIKHEDHQVAIFILI